MSCVRFYDGCTSCSNCLSSDLITTVLGSGFLFVPGTSLFKVWIWIVKGAVMCSCKRDILKRKLAIPEWNFYLEQNEDLIQHKCT